jgi:DNA-directed RNA polymerase specialized sigma24 family protein
MVVCLNADHDWKFPEHRERTTTVPVPPGADRLAVSTGGWRVMSAEIAELAVHLPQLRRFARALTGSQQIGDSYVLAALELAAAAPRSASTKDPSAPLFRALLRVWSPQADQDDAPADPGDTTQAADRNLRAITPRPRAAFLLRAMEGFSPAGVAAALDCTPREARALIDRAAREIAAQMRTDVLIIEDEALISTNLQELVEDLGHRVANVARTHGEAVAAVADQRPGLVLADIHLADDSSGLDAVNEIIAAHAIPVVFITGFPEQALAGARPEQTFLITKPFRTDTVKAVISQALFFDVRAHRSAPPRVN